MSKSTDSTTDYASDATDGNPLRPEPVHKAPPKGFDRPEERFFGRRKGAPLSAKKERLVQDLLPRLEIDTDTPDAASCTVADLFGPKAKRLWLEIGFGKGEHLAWQASNHADVGIIGCEPFMNGVAGALTHIDNQGLQNVRIHADDARQVMRILADGSLDRVFLIHPDPWPKVRHARRRFVNPIMLDELARLLAPGGEFRVGTDHPIYREWTAMHMARRTDFEWVNADPSLWTERPDDWPETRYEAKALEGYATYFIYKRR